MTPLTNMQSLSEVVNSLKKEGHTLDFQVKQGLLEILNDPKQRRIQPEETELLKSFRFEGMSNPSDNAILYVIRIRSGESGTLVNAYGSQHSDEINQFVKQIK